jgi:hypothetical protein
MDSKTETVRVYWYCEEHDDACYVVFPYPLPNQKFKLLFQEPEGDVCYLDRSMKHARSCNYTYMGTRRYVGMHMVEDDIKFRYEMRAGGFEPWMLDKVEQVSLTVSG